MPLNVRLKPLLTLITFNDELHENTQAYWRLSSIYNGQHPDNITFERAIRTCQALEKSVGPHRKLSTCVSTLGERIVEGRKRKSKPTSPPNNLSVLHGKTSSIP